jgi:D-alanyl-D-alanine endopeptidase (penicillin-binding protein 7)
MRTIIRKLQVEVVSLSHPFISIRRSIGSVLRCLSVSAFLAWLAPLALAPAAVAHTVAPMRHDRRAAPRTLRERRRLALIARRRRLRRELLARRARAVHHPMVHRPIVHRPMVHRPIVHRPVLHRRVLWQRSRAPALPVDAQSAYVVDADSGAVLLSKQADVVRPIASLTKLMLATVVLDSHPSMSQVIAITSDDIDRLKWSASRLEPGMAFTRRELLNLALMSSENRAAHALARLYPGGVAACVAAMNRKARQLGMDHTVYLDPTGLNPGNRSTAADLTRLVRAAAAYPLIREFTTDHSRRVVAKGETLMYRNTDHLVTDGWHLVLQKTGFINEAGHCLILDGDMDDHHVVVVLLGDPGGYADFADAEHIRAWLGREPGSAFAALAPGASGPGRG